METKQTAVEWYKNELNKKFILYQNGIMTFENFMIKKSDIYVQAKQLEKIQIIDAWEDGNQTLTKRRSEIYDNEYGKKYYEVIYL